MKKIFFAFIALLSTAFTEVKAQIGITDNYSKLYAGYVNMGIFDAPKYSQNDNGFLVGYAYGYNVTNASMPLFMEIGAEYSMVMGGEKPLNEKLHAFAIPLSLTYKFGNDEINFAPVVGFDARYNFYSSLNGESFNEFITTFQGGWHIGASLNFKSASLGYKFMGTFNEMVKYSNMSSYAHSIVLGLCF